MPKKPPRNKQEFRISGAPRSAASLLQGITRRVGVEPSSDQGLKSPETLLERLRAALPVDLGAHLLEARVRTGELVLYTDSAAWGAQLRVTFTEHMTAGSGRRFPELPEGTRVVVRLMPPGGYRR